MAVYAESGHPSIEELMAQQGTRPITDVSALHGDFWPEEELSRRSMSGEPTREPLPAPSQAPKKVLLVRDARHHQGHTIAHHFST